MKTFAVDLEAEGAAMYEPERSRGWTIFAWVIIGVAGVWNLIIGVAAFTKKDYFQAGSILYSNLSFWGVVWMIIGALQLLTALLVARRTTAGKALGLIGASVSMVVWFFSLGARPVAAILVIALDVLVLYALAADRPSAAQASGVADRYGSMSADAGRHFG